MKRRYLILFAVLILLCLPAMADETPALQAQVGYDGVMLEGQWVPVEAQILAGEQAFEGVLSVDVYKDSETYDRIEMPVDVPAGQSVDVRFSVLPQIRQSSFELVLRDASGEIAAKTEAAWISSIREEALVIGALGVDAAVMEALRLAEIRDVHGRLETIGVLALDENCFMRTEDELNALDALLIGEFDLRMLSAQQRALLEQWESEGGVLLPLAAEGLGAAQTDESDAIHEPGAEEQASRLLEAISQAKATGVVSSGYSNYTFGSSLTQSLCVGGGRSILPAAALLMIYAAVSGVGLYLYFARRDRGWMLWAAIPAAALLCTALIVAMGRVVSIAEPTAAQLRVTVVDEKGNSFTEESASVSYAGQRRAMITALDGSLLERREYAYYNDYSEPNARSAVLRDRIVLGEEPGIELAGGATWLTRNLMIRSGQNAKGAIDADAWMEEDGLHVRIHNGMETVLQNAFLLTEIGYASLGDIQPGDTAEALLARAQSVQTDPNGDFLIPPDTAIPYSASIYQSISALVDPERLTDAEFNDSRLSDAQQYERNVLSAKLGLSNQVRQDTFACLLVADTPQIDCTALAIDGRPIEKAAGLSVLIKRIAFAQMSPGGYFYYPQGTFCAHLAALDVQGRPLMGEQQSEAYLDHERIPACFGFRMEGVDGQDIAEIRVIAQSARRGQEPGFEVYDWQTERWIPLEGGLRARLQGELLEHALSEAGELYLRYGELDNESVYRPEIIVEGRESR